MGDDMVEPCDRFNRHSKSQLLNKINVCAEMKHCFRNISSRNDGILLFTFPLTCSIIVNDFEQGEFEHAPDASILQTQHIQSRKAVKLTSH